MPPRKPENRPVRGRYFVVPTVLLTSWLAAAVDDSAGPRRYADVANLSTFDYLVLASMADSPQLHAMAGFHSSASQLDEPTAAEERPVKGEDWRRSELAGPNGAHRR
jgi:hypothetical protein